MSVRVNITLDDKTYQDLVKCYNSFVAEHEWRNAPPSITGYTATLVELTIKETLDLIEGGQ